MSQRDEILTPVGRLVQGSLYDAQTTDAENKPLTYRTGPNAGQPRVQFYFAVAIAKGHEKHWSETEWGRKIWNIGHAGFPNGQTQNPSFAWKIKDGDSTIPNKAGRRPCDIEGFPGHWVLNFSGGFAPSIHTEDGSQLILEKDFVKLGDYIQVFGSVSDNESQQQPGVYLNHQMVAFSRYGKRIIAGADPKTVGFGKSPIPAGASITPLDNSFNPASPNSLPPSPSPMPPAYTPPPISPSSPPVVPYPEVLTPPLPPATPIAPARIMLPKANGITYEQYINNGWTDTLLIQHGMMQA